jgi:hypothetical protein
MPHAESPVARARSTLPAAAALFLLACLVIAAAWSAAETARAADEIHRSSVTLVQLAKLRAALAETRMAPSRSLETDAPRSPLRRARRAMRSLDRLQETESEALTRLEALVRERVAGAPPERAALIDEEIERLANVSGAQSTARYNDARRRLQTRGLQTMFLIAANGLIALGAATVALRPR